MGSDHVSSLAKGLEVLQAFNRERPELTISEVARIIGVTPAAARRSLLTLKDLGFIATHGKHYLLTPRVLRLSEAFLSSVSMQEVMHQFLQEIVDRTGDSASVGVLDGVDVVYVATVSVKRPYQLTPTGLRAEGCREERGADPRRGPRRRVGLHTSTMGICPLR